MLGRPAGRRPASRRARAIAASPLLASIPTARRLQKGLSDGDVILQVAGKDVSNPGDVRADIAAARQGGRKAVLMKIKTAQGERFIAFAFPNA